MKAPLSASDLAYLQAHSYADEAALDAAVAVAAAEKASDARFDALVRHDLADSCRALGMRLAASACAALGARLARNVAGARTVAVSA